MKLSRRLVVCAVLLPASAACGGKVVFDGEPSDGAGGGPGGTSGTSLTGIPAGIDVESDCNVVCARYDELACDTTPDCVGDCVARFQEVPNCTTELAVYVHCVADNTQGLSCSAFPYACDSAYSDYATCYVGGG